MSARRVRGPPPAACVLAPCACLPHRLRSATLSSPSVPPRLSDPKSTIPAACVLRPRSPRSTPRSRPPRGPCRPHLLQAALATRAGESGEGRQDGLAQRHGRTRADAVSDTGERLTGRRRAGTALRAAGGPAPAL